MGNSYEAYHHLRKVHKHLQSANFHSVRNLVTDCMFQNKYREEGL
jgi:hypothetical protein